MQKKNSSRAFRLCQQQPLIGAEQATSFTGGPDLLYLGHFAMVHKNYSENNDYQAFRYIVIALTGITENAQKSYNRLATQVVQ